MTKASHLPAAGAKASRSRPASPAAPANDKAPRTARGERTLRKILTAALEEFGERGFSEASIVGITRRAKVALGTFYTYFDSKEAIFSALVRDMSQSKSAFSAVGIVNGSCAPSGLAGGQVLAKRQRWPSAWPST